MWVWCRCSPPKRGVINLESSSMSKIFINRKRVTGFTLVEVLIALAILVPAYLLGNFLGRTALIAAVNAGMRISGLVGNAVKYLIYLLGVSMALEQLGIGRESVLVSFGIVFSGVVLALAIAFGLGGKDVAKEFLERKLGEKPHEDDIRHL